MGSGAKPLPAVRLVQKIVFFGGIVASVRAIVEDQTLVAIQIRDPYRSTPLFTHTHTHTQLLAHLDTQPVTRSVVVIMLFRTLLFVINYAARTDTISYTTYPGVTGSLRAWGSQSPRQTVPVLQYRSLHIYCNMPDPVICSL